MFLFFEFGLFGIMYIWYRARKIINRLTSYTELGPQLPLIVDLSNNATIPKYSHHLVYLTKANHLYHIEKKIIHSIFSRKPKRADTYWFIHIERTNEPYTSEYNVVELVKDKIIKVEFRIGFRIQPRIDLFFQQVIHDMSERLEIHHEANQSLEKYHLEDDFKFIVIERFLSYDNDLKYSENFILKSYFALKRLAISDSKEFGLDSHNVEIEYVPLIVNRAGEVKLTRIFHPASAG